MKQHVNFEMLKIEISYYKRLKIEVSLFQVLKLQLSSIGQVE